MYKNQVKDILERKSRLCKGPKAGKRCEFFKEHTEEQVAGGCKESDTSERLYFHFSLLCIGEGNGNPLQCSCLENPWDGGAWWAAVYGVTQSRTRLK